MTPQNIMQCCAIALLLHACGGNSNNNTPAELATLPESPLLSENTSPNNTLIASSTLSEAPLSSENTRSNNTNQNHSIKLWDVKYNPVPLINPKNIVLPRDISPTLIGAYGASCEGYIYRINLSEYEDALITFEGNEALKYPVVITGGLNVHVKGLEIVLEAQNECLPDTYTYSDGNKNIHPRAPTSRALGISPINSVFIEGTFIDVNGHDADCIVSNNSGFAENHDLLNKSKVLIQNSACYGIETSIDIHGDVFQTQGGALKELIFENFSVQQSAEGIVLSYPVAHTALRNFDYKTDPRFNNDDAGDLHTGAAFWDDNHQETPMTYSFENIYINYLDTNKTGWFYVEGHHFISAEEAGIVRYGVVTEYHPEIHFKELPLNGDAAPKEKIGRLYNPDETIND